MCSLLYRRSIPSLRDDRTCGYRRSIPNLRDDRTCVHRRSIPSLRDDQTCGYRRSIPSLRDASLLIANGRRPSTCFLPHLAFDASMFRRLSLVNVGLRFSAEEQPLQRDRMTELTPSHANSASSPAHRLAQQ